MKTSKIYGLALIAILMWSTAGTAFKLALETLAFSQLLLIASHTAWIILLIYAIITQQKIRIKPFSLLAKSAIGGFLNPFLYYLILLKAYSLLPAQIAQPLNYTWPIMLVILSVPFLKQKLSLGDLSGILISFIGVLIISSQGQNPFKNGIPSVLGVALAAGSSIIWASFWIVNVKDKRPELEKLLLNFMFGALFTTIYVVFFDQFPLPDTGWIPAVYVGTTEMAIAFICWLVALENTKNNARISNLVFISPFLALVFIHLILKEQIYFTTPLGLVFIIGGIFLQQLLAQSGKLNGKRQ